MNMYAFDVLPVHPQPYPLESFTGYLTRLAQANGLQHFSDVAHRLFPGLHPLRIRELTDYPPTSLENLVREAACTKNTLLATTFYHLARKFGRTPTSRPLALFLYGAVASQLRYCPQCLAEEPYYRLCWRLSLLKGCPRHGCSLLERCGNCGNTLRLLNANLRIGICPHCNTDLRTCIAPALENSTWVQMKKVYLDLEYLLLPQNWETGTASATIAVGHEFARLRRRLTQSTAKVSIQADIPQSGIRSIERGCALCSGATLLRYCRYAHYLGIPLRQIFENGLEYFATAEQEEHLAYEQQLEVRLQRTVHLLQGSAVPMNDQTLREWAGVSIQTLRKYPITRAILDKLETNAHQQEETILLQQVETAIQNLLNAGKPANRQDIYRLVGKGKFALNAYPRIRERLAQLNISPRTHKPVRARRDERVVVEQVHQAIRDLQTDQQPITQTAICDRVGLCLVQIRRYPQVKTLLKQARQLRVAQRETQLLKQAEQAIQTLQDTNQPLTLKAVAKYLGLAASTLGRFPAVHDFLKHLTNQQVSEQRTEQAKRIMVAIASLKEQQQPLTIITICQFAGMNDQTVRNHPELNALLEGALVEQNQAHAQQLLERAAQAIEILRMADQRVSVPSVCTQVGMSVAGLRKYPQVVELIRMAYHEDRARYKARLLQQVEEAAQQLQSCNLPLTQHAICAYIGFPHSSLHNYPAVKAVVLRIAKAHHSAHTITWGTHYDNCD